MILYSHIGINPAHLSSIPYFHTYNYSLTENPFTQIYVLHRLCLWIQIIIWFVKYLVYANKNCKIDNDLLIQEI